ncbi:MAG: pyridoxamine 5'-phosphate oxidase family protein [Nitrospirae bacterium]|nr:pyridoxamine 5'-phosphate oxidase family protein [Nitrospirota bacterium]
MRRADREISHEEAERLLAGGEYGVLSTVDKDGQPYGVPLNYVYRDGCIYFHSAPAGHKLDNIADNAKVSFCVIGATELLPAKFSTRYESVIAFGVASDATDAERDDALLWLVEKYSPGYIAEGKKYIGSSGKDTRVVKVEIGNISGKARR